MATMYRMNGGQGPGVGVFRTIEEARAWLGLES